jgi:hypothetical protein
MNIYTILYGILILLFIGTIGFLYSYIFYKGELHIFFEKGIGDECLPSLSGQCGTNAICTPNESGTKGTCTETKKV